jgi:predicted nucleic acid-binding protein
MRILFDTNVVLDVLLARTPHVGVATRLLDLVDRKRIEGLLGATTVTTLAYLATKAVGRRRAAEHLRELLAMFDIAAVDRDVLSSAMESRLGDYEDAVLHEAACAAGAAGIVTRNGKDFRGASLPIFAPAELLAAVLATDA